MDKVISDQSTTQCAFISFSPAQSINLGRIVVVFCYCYRVCKSFVQRVIDTSSLLSFMASLGSYLILTLLKVRFYEWLEQRGGLVRPIRCDFILPRSSFVFFLQRAFIAPDISSLFSKVPSSVILVGGVTLLIALVYRIYSGKK